MNTTALLAKLKRLDIKLWVEDDKLRFSAPKGALTGALKADIAEQKKEIISFLSNTDNRARQVLPPLKKADRKGALPLSFAQNRMWFLHQLAPDSSHYNMPAALVLKGAFDTEVLEQVFLEIVRRHEIIRTIYRRSDGKVRQVVRDPPSKILRLEDISSLEADRQDEIIRDKIQHEFQRPFDLTRDLMLRVKVFKLHREKHIIMFNMHHIASDGWSFGVIMKEFGELYVALSKGEVSGLSDLEYQYADYAAWQRETFSAERLETHLSHWKRELESISDLEFPADRPRTNDRKRTGAKQGFQISKELSDGVRAFAQKNGLTPFMVTLGVYQLLLARYTGQTDFCVGIPIAGRQSTQLEPLVGFFVNSLPVRVRYDGALSFNEYVQKVKESCLEAFAHQDLPFDLLVEKLQIERDLTRNPVFQTMFSFQAERQEHFALPELKVERLESATGQAKFDLILNVFDSKEGFRCSIEYDASLFDPATAKRYGTTFEKILKAVVERPRDCVQDIDILDSKERQIVLNSWNQTHWDFQINATLADLIGDVAGRYPDLAAVRLDDQIITYRELVDQSHRVALRLQNLGMKPEVIVGVCLGRSIEAVVVMLGVFRSGAAYLALDPQYPVERLKFMCQDADASVVVVDDATSSLFEGMGVEAVTVQSCLDHFPGGVEKLQKPTLFQDNVAYIVYTSGSTGTPKGIAITHSNLLNLVHWYRELFDAGPGTKSSQFASLSFDGSVWEIWPNLAAGSSVDIVPEQVRIDLPGLHSWIQNHQIDVCFLPTPVAHEFVQLDWKASHHPRLLFTGGAKLERRPPDNAPFQFIDLYGPSEITVLATCETVRAGDTSSMKIGRPIANTQAYVLDERLSPVPIGVVGELYLGGLKLARGYLKRPSLTAERFLPNPFDESPGSRMYRTGDGARWTEEGKLEFAGRTDDQVQLRGIRIELREIQAVLMDHPDIVQTAVVMRKFREGDDRLVAYVSLSTEAVDDKVDLAGHVGKKLPHYMIPSAFIFLEKLPFGPSGKIDLGKLPTPDWASLIQGDDFVLPEGDTETALADIWCDVLKISAVSVMVDFFQIGGHSLLATQVNSRIRRELDVELPLRKIFEFPTIRKLAAEIEKAEYIESLPKMQLAPRDKPLELSFAQNRMWFLNQLAPNSAYYNIPSALVLKGAIDIDVLESVFLEIARRHEIIRTVYKDNDGKLEQIVQEIPSQILRREDLSSIDASHQDVLVGERIREESRRPFDLTKDLMLRVKVFKLHQEKHIVVFNMHHIASDGWSFGIILKEIAELYDTFRKGQESRLPELEYQYGDYAAWQREMFSEEKLESHLAYWKQQLEDVTDLEFPTDRPRTNGRKRTGEKHGFQIGTQLSHGVRVFAKTKGLTPFMVTLGVYQLLLARYTGQMDFCVGTPIAGRRTTDLENLIGFFVNSLPLRVRYDGTASFNEYVQQVKETCLGAFAYQDLPFDLLVERLQIGRDLMRNPVFQTMFSFQAEQREQISLSGFEVEPLESSTGKAKFDLMLTVRETSNGMFCSFEYDADLLEGDTLKRLAEDYIVLLTHAVASPEKQIAHLPIMTDSALNTVLHDWNDTEIEYPRERLIHEIFSRVAKENSTQTALVLDEESLSYKQLEEKSNQLAHYLIARGVSSRTLVGLCLERSFDTVIALLAILKVGGTYVPLDPSYPLQRLGFMLEDTGLSAIITHSSLKENFPSDRGVQFVCLDEDADGIEEQPATCRDTRGVTGDGLAYVMYTSGSTGTPKGVAVTHKNVVRTANGLNYCTLDRDQTLFHYAPLSFDASTFEIWGALLNGARLVLCPPGPKSLSEISDQVQRHGVTTLWLTGGLFHKMVDENIECFSGLKQLLAGGDALSRSKVEKTLTTYPDLRVINGYGPTENTTFTACCNLSRVSELTGQVPIGRPVSNTEIYILDSELQPVPVGAIGELYTSGDGVARGYLNRPALTSEKFLPNPFGRTPGDRMYRTGDLARWLSDGRIEFYGRRDTQVKIRGHRIELGEIESHLLEHPHIKRCTVGAMEDGHGDKRLVAYIVTDGEGIESSKVRSFLEKSLPSYLVPSIIVELDSLPLMVNGKIDRDALRDPDLNAIVATGEFVEPANETEERLAQIWKDVLHIEKLSTQADFFSIGGHSLLATKAVSVIKEAFQINLKLIEFFENPTVQQLGRLIGSRSERSKVASISRVDERAYYPCTSAQRRMYILNMIDSAGVSYNVPIVVRVKGLLNRARFQEVFTTLAARHDAMRTRFGMVDGEIVQYVEDAVEIDINFSEIDKVSVEDAVKSFIRPFDLARTPLWRVGVFQTSEDESVLVVDAHHIVLDGVSLVNLVIEFGRLYAGEDTPDIPLQQKDFAVWQMEEYLPTTGKGDEQFWLETLGEELPVLRLPTDRPRAAVQSFRGSKYCFTLDEQLSDSLRSMAKTNKSTLFFTLLGIYKILLHKYTGQEDVIVGVPSAGRSHHDLEGAVGMFVNTLPLRSFPTPSTAASEFLSAVKDGALKAFEHQLYPYEELLNKLGLARDTSRNPLFDTMFSMFDSGLSDIVAAGLQFLEYSTEQKISKFDLSFGISDEGTDIAITIEYCRDLFDRETIEQLGESFVLLCESLCGDPQKAIRDMQVISGDEQRRLLEDFGSNPQEVNRKQNIIEMFESTVAKFGDKVAVVDGTLSLRYADLKQRSDQLASQFLNRGAKRGDSIAVVLRRSSEAIISFLAILKARCVYVPVDPFSPLARKQIIIEDCCAKIVLCDDKEEQAGLRDTPTVCPDRLFLTIAEELTSAMELENCCDSLNVSRSLDDIAYTIYTSGSTGTPKGVLISHASLAHYVQAYCIHIGVDEKDTMINLSSLSFDVSVEEIAVPLSIGGRIVVFPQERAFDIEKLIDVINQNEVTVVAAAPLLLAELARRGPLLVRNFIAGGDSLKAEHLHGLHKILNVWNAYGPTETTVAASAYKLSENEETNIPIGWPWPNYELLVLDKDLALRPRGVPGQLFISGPGVAAGYLNRKELTAERFIPNPYRPGARMYATGDLVKWRFDGALLFLGRVDRQIQIRGFRVELGEIEHAIDSLPRVDGSLVIDKEDSSGAKYLVCYYTTIDQLPLSDFREELSSQLPGYMVPQHLVHLEGFPTNLSGKTDIRKLPDPADTLSPKEGGVQPRTTIEAEIYELWQRTLDLKIFDINENFFDIGGNSLRLLQLHEAINAKYDRNLRLIDLFNHPTVKKMSRLLQSTAESSLKTMLPANELPGGFFVGNPTDISRPNTLRAKVNDLDLSSVLSQPTLAASSVSPIHIHLGVMLQLFREYSGLNESSANALIGENELTLVEVDFSAVDDFNGLFIKIAKEHQMSPLSRIALVRGNEPRSIRPLLVATKDNQLSHKKLLEIFDMIFEIDNFTSPSDIRCTYNEHQLVGDKVKSLLGNYVHFFRLLVSDCDERSS